MSAATFPASLRTPTPGDGLTLARQLAASALAERTVSIIGDMTAHPSSPSAPSLEALTAAYFHAVAAANLGWSR